MYELAMCYPVCEANTFLLSVEIFDDCCGEPNCYQMAGPSSCGRIAIPRRHRELEDSMYLVLYRAAIPVVSAQYFASSMARELTQVGAARMKLVAEHLASDRSFVP